MLWKRIGLVLMIVLISAGCSFPGTGSNQPTASVSATDIPVGLTASAPLATSTPDPTPLPTSTPAPTASPTPEPFVPFSASVWADNVNVRSNPGLLFSVITNVKKGTTFTVLGKSPGGDWIHVQTADNTKAWVYTLLLEAEKDLLTAPEVQPENVQLIRGRVVDASGQPIRGIQFAVVQGTGDQAPRNDALTDANGDFYAFMPLNASGEWAVSFTAVSCKSSVMDENCNCLEGRCGTVEPLVSYVTLPVEEPLQFVWK